LTPRRLASARSALALLGVLTLPASMMGQTAPGGSAGARPPGSGPGQLRVEKVGDQLYRIGSITVDAATRELSVPGTVNRVTFLEWIANTPGGMKAYESAFTIEANAVPFNTALLLLGLDPANARVPKQHFDPIAPKGDPVEIWVEWNQFVPGSGQGAPGAARTGPKQRARVEQFLYDKVNKVSLPEGPWVYTGSTFVAGTNRYMADLDGVLIGFVHSPAPILENPRSGAVNRFGDVVFNESLGVRPGTPITLIVKAIGPKKSK
jgi:hypothetical protein